MTNSACSDLFHESLPGTAKSGKLFVALEHPYGWSRDILDGGVFGDELTARIKAWLAERGGSLQLIRKSGRLGQAPCAGVTMYIAHCPPGVGFGGAGEGGGAGRPGPRLERMTVAGAEEMIGLDIRLGRPTDGAEEVDGPLLLVCTHGKRDVCCALKGRPLAAALSERHPGTVVWETSHTKGHRFAASVLLMPWGYSYGRLNEEAGDALVRAALRGEYFHPGNRGRGLHGPRGQVAELAVARELLTAGEQLFFGELAVLESDEGVVVVHSDGRSWHVTLEQRDVEGVVSSCGDAPKTGRVWVAADVRADRADLGWDGRE